MFKRTMILLLTIVMIFSAVGCSQAPETNEPTSGSEQPSASDANDNWKIGIITGTVTQNEEEYRAAERVQAKYGAEHVIMQTYPDKFMDEQETVIANITGIASDPDVKVIIACQAVPGTVAAFEKIREMRGDDILLVSGVVAEDPAMSSSRSDICLQMDELGMGPALIDQIIKQGAKTFVHYSFPRHMSYALLSARRDIWIDLCEEKGIDFVDATAPDPTGDAGTSGAQQFILEDVPKKVEKYGVDTAFFSTNCAMQAPLIKAVFETGAIYPQPWCPSPYHGFPSSLDIKIPEEKQGDTDWMISEIRKIMAEKGMTGRMSTWPVPVAMSFITATSDYAVKWINGEITEKLDMEALNECFVEDTGVNMTFTLLEQDGVTYDNYIMVLCDYIDL